MEEDPEDLTSLHYQIMFPPREPCHRQREYELEQHLALMDEPATARPAASMDMGDLGNLTIEHLSGYDDVGEAQKFLLVDDERYPKEEVLEIGIEASDLGSLLQQFEQKEAALTITDPSEVSKPQQTSSATKKISGPKNPSKKIVPVKRKSTILMEPIAMPSKRLRDKVPDERMSVSLPGSRTSSPLTVQPQGLSVICSADQGFDYLIMDHDYCNVQDTKLASQEQSGPANKAGQLAAEQRKALYKQKYKIRKKGKIKGRVVGGHYSEKALAEGVVSETDKPAFINKLPDYIHPMPEVSTANSVKNAEVKNTKQGVVVPMPQPQPEKEALPKGKKPEFFDKIPDYFIGKHMYQEISKVKEAEEAEKQAREEEMTKLKEKPVEANSLHKKSKLEPSKDNEGAATHPEAHRHKSRHHHHHHKAHIQGQVRNSIIKDRDAAINNGGELIDANEVNCQQPQVNHTEQTSNQQSSSGKQTMTKEGTKEVHMRKSRKSSYSERLSRSRSRSRSYSSYSSSSSRSSARSRSYSSSSSDSRYSQTRRRGPSYISRSRSRSYSRSRSRSRSHSYRRRRRRYSTYSSASHSSSSISRSRSRSHSRSRHWRPRSHSFSRSFSRSRSRSRSRSHSRDSCMRQRRRSSRRESRQRTRSRSERRHRRSASIEQIEERREQRIEEQLEQWKDRRVVYIGRIPYGTTRTVIRRRFEKFGEIERITLHFRDEGDNYAFVTYNYKCDAYAAVEGANKDPEEPVYDICFGGRRQFCKSNYEDLDSMAQEEEAFDYGYKPSSSSTSGKVETDFDRLLQEAMRKVKR